MPGEGPGWPGGPGNGQDDGTQRRGGRDEADRDDGERQSRDGDDDSTSTSTSTTLAPS